MFPNIAKETGVPQDMLAAARAAFQSEGLEAAASFIGDDIVDALSAAGTPDECRARLDDYRRAGITLPVVIPLEGAFELTIETLGENAPPVQS
jgi:5,10-methylenetetrahydromethanopterin reductase